MSSMLAVNSTSLFADRQLSYFEEVSFVSPKRARDQQESHMFCVFLAGGAGGGGVPSKRGEGAGGVLLAKKTHPHKT